MVHSGRRQRRPLWSSSRAEELPHSASASYCWTVPSHLTPSTWQLPHSLSWSQGIPAHSHSSRGLTYVSGSFLLILCGCHQQFLFSFEQCMLVCHPSSSSTFEISHMPLPLRLNHSAVCFHCMQTWVNG